MHQIHIRTFGTPSTLARKAIGGESHELLETSGTLKKYDINFLHTITSFSRSLATRQLLFVAHRMLLAKNFGIHFVTSWLLKYHH